MEHSYRIIQGGLDDTIRAITLCRPYGPSLLRVLVLPHDCRYRKEVGMTDWQPIETAPVGEEVLVYFPGPNYDCEFSFDDPEVEGMFTLAVCKVGEFETGGRTYRTFHGYYSAVDPSDAPPTHWMPLPEPPPSDRLGV